MEIQVDTDHNVNADQSRIAGIEIEVRAVLGHRIDHLTRVEVRLSDESAGRSTGEDKRCVLQARPAGRAPVAVTYRHVPETKGRSLPDIEGDLGASVGAAASEGRGDDVRLAATRCHGEPR